MYILHGINDCSHSNLLSCVPTPGDNNVKNLWFFFFFGMCVWNKQGTLSGRGFKMLALKYQ